MDQLRSAGLTGKQTECLALWCFDGLTQQEIGERMGITQQAASKHMASARKKLKKAGMSAKKLQMPEQPRMILMDPARMDHLGPADIRAQF